MDSGYSSLDADIFVPLDLNWRRTYYKTSFIKRALAYVIDIFITSVPSIFIAFIFSLFILPLVFGTTTAEEFEKVDDMDIGIAFFIWEFIFFSIIISWMESSRWKGTFGKLIMKIQITDSYGNPISFWRALLRNILKMVTTTLYIFVVPLIVQIIMFIRTKQLFHDKFSDTIVGERLGQLK